MSYKYEYKPQMKYCVRIASENESGKVIENEFETETVFGATRIIHTFKPKRGYVAFDWNITKVEVLL
jgi:hypothetical protein